MVVSCGKEMWTYFNFLYFIAGIMADPTKIPLIGAASKPKREEKSYWFELKLQESNDETYPEFSWTELVADKKSKEAKNKLSSGKCMVSS